MLVPTGLGLQLWMGELSPVQGCLLSPRGPADVLACRQQAIMILQTARPRECATKLRFALAHYVAGSAAVPQHAMPPQLSKTMLHQRDASSLSSLGLPA